MKNKRGLSTIVVTLIILVITLVSVGILYAIYNNIISQNKGQVDLQSKCISASARVVKAEASNPNKFKVTFQRDLGATMSADKYKFTIIPQDNGPASCTEVDNIATSATGTSITNELTCNGLTPNEKIRRVIITPVFTINGVDTDCTNPTTTDF